MMNSYNSIRYNLARFIGMSTLLILTFLWASVSYAHGTRPAVSDVTIADNQVQIEVFASFEPFIAGIDMAGLADTDDAPEAAEYDRLRALPDAEFEALLRSEWPQLVKGFKLTGAGPLSLDRVEIDAEPELEFPRDTRVFLSAPLADGAEDVTFGWVARNGALVVRNGEGDDAWAILTEGGQVSKPINVTGGVDESTGQVIWRFLVSGFDHIIPKGLDHILFVLGLFFFALHWRPMLWQVTSFTLAHTVTLGLATIGIINIPDEWMWFVETLIALSITWVAIENILRPTLGWWRIGVVFGFGLLHGLGFASVLGDFGLAQGQFIISLIAFNIGVEIGQLAVILATFLLMLAGVRAARMSRLPAEEAAAEALPVMHRAVSIFGSLIIAIIGLYWVVERAFL